MSNIELVGKDRVGPGTGICPHCKRKMIISLDMFRDNVAKVVEDKCPYCRKPIFSCILVLSNATMDRLLNQLKRVIMAAKGEI